MSRPYKNLRLLMQTYDFTTEALAEELGCSRCTVSHKLNAHHPWTSNEMWKIMELFEQSPSKLHELFPMNGQNEPGVKRKRPIRPV